MKIPPSLKPGDTVGIIATARMIPEIKLKSSLKALEEWGLKYKLGKNLFEAANQFAGTDAQRAEDLQTMLEDDSVKAILCARGGYGTQRIIDQVDFKPLRKNPKWIIGFSDITALLIQCYNEGICSLHAPMAVSWDGKTGNPQAFSYLRRFLMQNEWPEYAYQPKQSELVRPGLASGKVIGGNLSLLDTLTGTPTDFNTKNALLFLEDIDEYPYRIDRMVVHLKRCGKFEKLAGLIVGGFTSIPKNDTPFGKTAEEITIEPAADYTYPIALDFPVGHWPQNWPLVIGAEATLKVSHSRIEFGYNQ